MPTKSMALANSLVVALYHPVQRTLCNAYPQFNSNGAIFTCAIISYITVTFAVTENPLTILKMQLFHPTRYNQKFTVHQEQFSNSLPNGISNALDIYFLPNC